MNTFPLSWLDGEKFSTKLNYYFTYLISFVEKVVVGVCITLAVESHTSVLDHLSQMNYPCVLVCA